MKKINVLKTIGAICFGSGVGLCVGVASKSVIAGILVGLGLGICFAVSFNSFKK